MQCTLQICLVMKHSHTPKECIRNTTIFCNIYVGFMMTSYYNVTNNVRNNVCILWMVCPFEWSRWGLLWHVFLSWIGYQGDDIHWVCYPHLHPLLIHCWYFLIYLRGYGTAAVILSPKKIKMIPWWLPVSLVIHIHQFLQRFVPPHAIVSKYVSVPKVKKLSQIFKCELKWSNFDFHRTLLSWDVKCQGILTQFE